MNTNSILAALCGTLAFACAAPTAPQPESELPPVETSVMGAEAIKQGPCSPTDLALGGWEAGGYCYTGGSAPGDVGGPAACTGRCDSGFSRCEARCEARGGSEACFESCYRQESLCYAACR